MMNKAVYEKEKKDCLMGVYIHVPFCVKKCAYCDFLSFPASEFLQKAYVRALQNEILHFENPFKRVCSVFIGGGTPSLLNAAYIFEIMETLHKKFLLERNAEITVECNPGTVDSEKLNIYRAAGINRISFGLQATDDATLQRIGRIHTYNDFLESYAYARSAGFQNINVDLMAALPGQTLELYLQGIRKVLTCKPQHISAYSLILENNTPMFENIAQYPPLPDEDLERTMYYETNRMLSAQGYERYEISNFAKKGFACKHNRLYWERGDYAGFGLGAASLLQGIRYKNTENIKEYIEKAGRKSVIQEREVLTKEDCMSEFMFLGLRESRGVSAADFKTQFGVSMQEIFGGVLQKHIENKLIYCYSNAHGQSCFALTARGIDVSNVVLADYLLE